MATAVQSSAEPRTPNPRARLALASLFGALFVLAGIAVAGYLIPQVWQQFVAPGLSTLGLFANVAMRIVVQLAAIAGVFWLGTKLLPADPPKGLRGGIFLVLTLLIAVFFISRSVGMALEDQGGLGLVITSGVFAVLLALSYRLIMSDRGERWMVQLEEQGWFHAFSYKRTQGTKARRYTFIGFLILGWSGVYTLISTQSLGTGNWNLRIPFDLGTVQLLNDIEYSIPILIAVAVFWISWRAINLPAFADFLIATEAEMNKVSWSSRKRLLQDTVVVLVTCLILTTFLLVVDLFWGWLLSREVVGVLPPRSTAVAPVDPTQGNKAKW